MPKSEFTYSVEVERVVHAAVASAMMDFAALLLAYGREGPMSEEVIAYAQEQVLMVLKNASATSLPLELQAVALNRAVEEVMLLINNAIRRPSPSQPACR